MSWYATYHVGGLFEFGQVAMREKRKRGGVDRPRQTDQQMDRSMAQFRVQKRSYVQRNNTYLPSKPTCPDLAYSEEET